MGHRLRRAAGAVLVFAVSICASPPPFSWEAHEGHEIAISAPTSARNGAGHVSHVAETGSHQTRVTPSNVCAVSEAVSEVGTNQKATGFSPWLAPLAVLTVVFVFMLGWYCGRQQALSSFALQQAAQEDEQAKAHEAAKAAAPAVTSVIHAAIEAPANNEQTHDSIADAISLSSADSSFEYVQSSEADSGPAADSAKDPHTSSTSAAEPCHSRFQCSHQAQLTALDSSSSSSHVPTQELNVASGPDSGSPVQQQQQQQSMLPATQLSPAYPQSRGQQVNVFSGASQILDQTLQHLGLRRLQDLSESERMSLIPTCMHALEVYTSHLHKEEDHRLHGIANAQSGARNSIMREGQADEQAWRTAKVQKEQLQDFKLQIADSLMCGLIVMLAGILYFGSALGFWEGKLSQCTNIRYSTLASFWRPMKGFDILSCYVSAFWEFCSSLLILCTTVYCIKRFGLLTDSTTKPMAAMALLLGVVCGWLGRMVIDKLGGHGLGWVVGYEAWIFTQIFAVWCVCPLHELLQAKDTGGAMQHLKLPCYMLATGLLAPVAVAACPFWANWANFW